jgi:methionyl-tRNA synthetase
MSKSMGNVIDPIAIVAEYGADALRYFLARHIHPFEDSDFTMERFKEAYNADLANGLGNLSARVMQLAQINLPGPVELPTLSMPREFADALERFEFNKALDMAAKRIQALDQKINATAPFTVVKTDPEKGKVLITDLVKELAAILYMLWPVIPEKGHVIWEAIKQNKKPENLFPRKG